MASVFVQRSSTCSSQVHVHAFSDAKEVIGHSCCIHCLDLSSIQLCNLVILGLYTA